MLKIDIQSFSKFFPSTGSVETGLYSIAFNKFLVSFFMDRSYLADLRTFGKIPDAKQLLYSVVR